MHNTKWRVRLKQLPARACVTHHTEITQFVLTSSSKKSYWSIIVPPGLSTKLLLSPIKKQVVTHCVSTPIHSNDVRYVICHD